MRPTRAAVEPCRHTRTAQCVFEQTKVAMGGSDENRHLVETHATTCLGQHPPRDLDRLTRFAGCREDAQRPVEYTLRRQRISRKQEPAEGRQVIDARRLATLDDTANAFEKLESFTIPVWNCRECRRCGADQGADQLTLSGMIHR